MQPQTVMHAKHHLTSNPEMNHEHWHHQTLIHTIKHCHLIEHLDTSHITQRDTPQKQRPTEPTEMYQTQDAPCNIEEHNLQATPTIRNETLIHAIKHKGEHTTETHYKIQTPLNLIHNIKHQNTPNSKMHHQTLTHH